MNVIRLLNLLYRHELDLELEDVRAALEALIERMETAADRETRGWAARNNQRDIDHLRELVEALYRVEY